jgi:hypothetical protein
MCVLALVCGVTAFVASFRVTDGRWVIGTLGVLFIVCGLGMFIRPETVVDSGARVVSRHSRLFGRFPFWSRRYPFSDFCAVVIRHVRRSNFGRDSDQYFVSLRRRSGRQVLIRYFEADIARNCRPAEELGRRLSADLQIEIDEKDG